MNDNENCVIADETHALKLRKIIMTPELERELYALAPIFFREHNEDKMRTCMCWGIECGDGWYAPIMSFAIEVELLNEMLKCYNLCITASQVKSKLAIIRIRWALNRLSERPDATVIQEDDARIKAILCIMDDLVGSLESKCDHICEECGQEEDVGHKVITCSSTLTRKCLSCAQRQQNDRV